MDQHPAQDRDPGERPQASRRLETPPSARYGPPTGRASATDPASHAEAEAGTSAPATPGGSAASPGSPRARALVIAIVASLVGAAAIVLLAGILGQTAGLLAAVALTGIVVGRTLRGPGVRFSPSMRLVIALILVLDAVALGNLGTWAYAVSEGGVLGPVDYLLETFGPLVAVEFVVGGAAAVLASR